jgi:hypothetical protein
MVAVPPRLDPTLEAVNAALEAEQDQFTPSGNIGFGDIGKCDRWIWNKINAKEAELLSADSLRIFRNGHEDEAAMARDLRKVDGIELYTHDSRREGKQYKYSFLDGRLTGRLDGVIVGLKQAPVTPHVWEHKSTNERKFDKLLKLGNLREWDSVYAAQAHLCMYATELDRHYMTVSTPGLRKVTSLRTELDAEYAKALIAKAQRIIGAKTPPECVCDSWSKFKCEK